MQRIGFKLEMTKCNLLIPMAGKGQRFVDMGFRVPKPLVMVDDKHIIDWSFESIDTSLYNLIFCVRKDHIDQFSIDRVLKNKFGEDISIVVIHGDTAGSVETCILAKDLIDNDIPLAIYTLDVYFKPNFDYRQIPNTSDGHILTFKSNNPAYSYVLNEPCSDRVVATAEKSVISSEAATGVYYFKTGKTFVKYAQRMINEDLKTFKEYYICPLYNLMISDLLKVTSFPVEKMHVMGTPQELDFFRKNVLKYYRFTPKPIGLCSDHSGYELKKICIEYLKQNRIEYIDFGVYNKKDCDYNIYVDQVAEAIQRGDCDYGFGFCRTGQGINIAANKHDGIRSGLVINEYMTEMAIRHNCVNFFAFSEKEIDSTMMKKMVDIIMTTTFDGGRHTGRVQ